MPQAQRFGLGHKHCTHPLGQDIADQRQLIVFAGLLQLLFQFVGFVEIVRHRVLVAVGDKHQGLATGGDGFIHRVLNQRPINDRQHLLGHGFGGRQKAGA